MIDDIIHIIYEFYLIVLDLVILKDQRDIDIFYNLLSPTFASISNKQGFELRLLYRNNGDGNDASFFHKDCDGNTNTLTLVHQITVMCSVASHQKI